jgi:hypothetical protein
MTEEEEAREYVIGVSIIVAISTAVLWAFKISSVDDIMPWWMASIIAILWLACVGIFWLQEIGPKIFLCCVRCAVACSGEQVARALVSMVRSRRD